MNIDLFLLCVFLLAHTSVAQVGRNCKFEYTGLPGICKLSSDCPLAKKQSQQGIRPTICGYAQNNLPIVCCEGQLEVNEFSLLNFEYPTSNEDIVYPGDNANRNKISISEQKCNEYSKSISGEFQILPLIAGALPTNVNITTCDFDGVALIVGGSPAQLGEFPFMAAIGYQDSDEVKWYCGGTLVSDRYVITAAHCTYHRTLGSPVRVRLGELDLAKDDEGASPVDYDIDNIISHPGYKRSQKYNDIALMKLGKKVQFNKYIRPACLWSSPELKQPTAFATGWGLTSLGGDSSDVLQKVSLNIIQNNHCQKVYNNSRGLPNGVLDNMICAGELTGGKDTCQGDSGGPLFVTKKDNQCVFYLVGITSFGKSCAVNNTPAIYSKVASFVKWIEETIW